MSSLLAAALLTIVIETSFLAAVGYRSPAFLGACTLMNLFTNVSLNAFLRMLSAENRGAAILPCEAAAVLIEWAVLSRLTKNKGKLLLYVFLANLLSFSAGLLLYGRPC